MLARAIVIGIGLAVMLPGLIYHGITSIYPQPKREAFFGLTPQILIPQNATQEERKAQAEDQQRKQQLFGAAMREFSKVRVLVTTVLGALAILAGALLPVPAIAAGVIAGGALSIGVGYWSYGSDLPEWWRFASLLVGSLSLVFVGYRQWRHDLS
jgi:uncharacterized membrane protein YphA (DoxX/SURF4 family)